MPGVRKPQRDTVTKKDGGGGCVSKGDHGNCPFGNDTLIKQKREGKKERECKKSHCGRRRPRPMSGSGEAIKNTTGQKTPPTKEKIDK